MTDRFTKECSRLVCLQMASMAGFDVVSSGSLDVLSDVMETYVQELCKTTRSYAEGAGRTEVNAEDLALGLGDVGTSLSSVREFKQSLKDEVPFTTTVPKFPVAPPVTKKTSFRDTEEAPPTHIPDFLPKFPPRHTYIHTSVFPKHQDDSREKALRALDAKKAAEDVLVRLGQGAEAVDNPFVASLLDATQPDPAGAVSSQPETTPPMQGDSSKKSDDWTSILLEKGEKKSTGLSVPLPFHMDPLAILRAAIAPGGKKKRTRDAFEEKDKSQKRSKSSNVDLSLFQFNIREGHGDGSRGDGGIRANSTVNNGNPGAMTPRVGGGQVGGLVDNGANTETTVNGTASKHANFTADKSGLANGNMKEDTGSDEGPTVSQKVEDRTDEEVEEGEEADIKAQEDGLVYGVHAVRNNEEEEEEEDYPSEDVGQDGAVEDEFVSDDVEREPMGEDGDQQQVEDYDERAVEGYTGGGLYEEQLPDNGDPEDDVEEKEPPLVSGLFLDLDGIKGGNE
ncbi:hypothetical protein BSKO_01238 [Bryopsis sp. KO-2023]|nr:hypothetical protein BSKO_01238 [Bryopsis sp. KO-2023]